jgi:hypothetical protein
MLCLALGFVVLLWIMWLSLAAVVAQIYSVVAVVLAAIFLAPRILCR